MPRGVPASGKRQPRAVFTAESAAEAPMAVGSVDESVGVESSTEDEVESAGASAGLDLDDEPGAVEDDAAPVPEEELTPEQREIQYLRDQLARLSGKKDIEPEVEELVQPGGENNILIHFLEDGLTALGKVWFRGQELEFAVGSRAYQDTFDRNGKSWLDLRFDEFAQVERWGKIMFRAGPWPGKTYLDGNFEPMRSEKGDARVPPPSEEELAAAEKRRKQRSAPRLPSLSNA